MTRTWEGALGKSQDQLPLLKSVETWGLCRRREDIPLQQIAKGRSKALFLQREGEGGETGFSGLQTRLRYKPKAPKPKVLKV